MLPDCLFCSVILDVIETALTYSKLNPYVIFTMLDAYIYALTLVVMGPSTVGSYTSGVQQFSFDNPTIMVCQSNV